MAGGRGTKTGNVPRRDPFMRIWTESEPTSAWYGRTTYLVDILSQYENRRITEVNA